MLRTGRLAGSWNLGGGSAGRLGEPISVSSSRKPRINMGNLICRDWRPETTTFWPGKESKQRMGRSKFLRPFEPGKNRTARDGYGEAEFDADWNSAGNN
jgi:hypothetical protein